MVLHTYKYWFKMLKRWKFPRLIKARASSTNCTMGNLATQHTYIQSMLNIQRFISFLLYKSLTKPCVLRQQFLMNTVKTWSACYSVGITAIFTLFILMTTQTVKPALNCTTVFSKLLRLVSELVEIKMEYQKSMFNTI